MDERYKIISSIDSNDDKSMKTALDTHNDDNVVVISSFKQPIVFNDEFIELYKRNSSSLIDINHSDEELTLINRHFESIEVIEYIKISDSFDPIEFALSYLTLISKYDKIPTYLQYMFTLPSQNIIVDDKIQTCDYLLTDDHYKISTFKDVMSNIGSILKIFFDAKTGDELESVTYLIDSLIGQEASFGNIKEILIKYKTLVDSDEQEAMQDESDLKANTNTNHDRFAHINDIISRNKVELDSSESVDKKRNNFNKVLLMTFVTLSVFTLILLYFVFTYL